MSAKCKRSSRRRPPSAVEYMAAVGSSCDASTVSENGVDGHAAPDTSSTTTSTTRMLLERTAAEESERDDVLSELPSIIEMRRQNQVPRRSVTLNRSYQSRVSDSDEFSSSNNSSMVSRSHSLYERTSRTPSGLSRTLSHRESVRMVLRSGSMRAAHVASMIVTPARDHDVKVDEWIRKYRCMPPPLFMILISIVELGVFIGYLVDQENRYVSTTPMSGVPAHSPLIYQPTRRYEAWRFLSYMFIHDGYVHIISNLIFQLAIGLPLEMVHDFRRVGPLYFSGVLAGSLATSVVDPWVLLCGASGGCYALLGAQFATITMNWKEMKAGWLNSPLKFLLSGPFQLAFWSVLAIFNTSVSIYSRLFDVRIAFAAHIAGLISGYLVGLCVLKNFSHKSWKWTLRIVALLVFGVLTSFAIIFNAVYDDYYPPTDWRPCCPAPSGLFLNDNWMLSDVNSTSVYLVAMTSDNPWNESSSISSSRV